MLAVRGVLLAVRPVLRSVLRLAGGGIAAYDLHVSVRYIEAI
jgi:hypothetical protein